MPSGKFHQPCDSLGKGWEGGEGVGADGSVSLWSLEAFHSHWLLSLPVWPGSLSEAVTRWAAQSKEVILQSHLSGLYERI